MEIRITRFVSRSSARRESFVPASCVRLIALGGHRPGKSEGVPAWQDAGFKSERTYFRHKARALAAQSGSEIPSRHLSKNRKRYAFSLPSTMPISTLRADAIDPDGINLRRFGIIAVRVMRGTQVLRTWAAPVP